MLKVYQHTSDPGVAKHRPPALYDMCTLLKAHLPDLPRHMLVVVVLALRVEGTLLALNCYQIPWLSLWRRRLICSRCGACCGSCYMT